MIKIIDESLQIHKELNPKLWENNKLKQEIYSHCMRIVDEFRTYVDVPMRILDIRLVGSNASFNYTDTSDIDLHIVADFSDVSKCGDVVKAMYNAERKAFNKSYDISIHGMDVEIYVEDINSNSVSNGIYSLVKNKWVKYPQPITVKEFDTSKDVEEWKSKISSALESENLDQIQGIIDDLYLMRKDSIALQGEYSKGNQVFKDIRSLGLLDELKDKLYKLKSKELSIENYNRGEM